MQILWASEIQIHSLWNGAYEFAQQVILTLIQDEERHLLLTWMNESVTQCF